MSCHSVVRIGPLKAEDGCYASLVRSSITKHFQNNAASNESNKSNDQHRIAISNRYFDASVIFAALNESESVGEESSIVEDGIILVFDSSPTASQDACFDSLSTLHDNAEKSVDNLGDLLRLCVGVSFGPSPLADGTKASEEEYSRRVLWCLDRGYEYVEADMSPIGMESGHDERDKEGFARIIEAISSCMWSSHVMKKRSQPSKVVSDSSSADDNTATKPSDQKSDDVREKAAVANLMEGVDQDTDSNIKDEEVRQQEMAFHQLESVIADAKSIRAASQDNSMSDEERRKRAGDTALRMMELFEKLGFDGDDEEDEEDSDETEASSLPDGVIES